MIVYDYFDPMVSGIVVEFKGFFRISVLFVGPIV